MQGPADLVNNFPHCRPNLSSNHTTGQILKGEEWGGGGDLILCRFICVLHCILKTEWPIYLIFQWVIALPVSLSLTTQHQFANHVIIVVLAV